MSNTSSNVQIGPGFLGLCILASIALAILKLMGVLTVTWLIVALPALVGLAISILLIIAGIIMLTIFAIGATR